MKRTLNGGIELGFLNAISEDRELTDKELATQKELSLHPKGEWVHYDSDNNVITKDEYYNRLFKEIRDGTSTTQRRC